MEDEAEYDSIYKMVIVGDSGVGKTGLLSRYIKNEFDPQSKATVGIEFSNKQLDIDGQVVKVQIWDTAGQERFRSLTSSYYRGSQCALVVYDVTREETFEHVDKWVSDLRSFGGGKIVIMLIGNKSDLKEERTVSIEQGQNKANGLNILFIEASALNSENVANAFEQTIKKAHQTNKSETELDCEFVESNKAIDLNSKSPSPEAKKCC